MAEPEPEPEPEPTEKFRARCEGGFGRRGPAESFTTSAATVGDGGREVGAVAEELVGQAVLPGQGEDGGHG